MAEAKAQELQLPNLVQEVHVSNSIESANVTNQSTIPAPTTYKWWLRMSIYTLLVLAGQSVATLLGRLYYDKGGNSKWMASLVQTAGFPILLPYYFFSQHRKPKATDGIPITNPPSTLTLASVYVSLGILLAAACMLYSIGLLYLPVSTYSLICASQLAFNAFFSYFLNAQKFTPYIINSLVLLTISSTLLVFQSDSANNTQISKVKYAVGFVCTVAASAGYALLLSLTQFAFQKVLKRKTFSVVMDMIIYQSLFATLAILVGLFASGEWKDTSKEMEEYKLGKVSYVMTLVWIAINWQVFSIGAVGIIFEVSSLFTNVISTLGLPVVPIFAVVFYNDRMSGVKVIAMVLAVWAFVSYVYQHYLDERKNKTDQDTNNFNGVCRGFRTDEVHLQIR